MIDDEGTVWEPCAWCGMDEMDEYGSFNSKDICIDCEKEALEQANKEETNAKHKGNTCRHQQTASRIR